MSKSKANVVPFDAAVAIKAAASAAASILTMETSLETLNKEIKLLHDMKVKVGAYPNCPIATSFRDTLTASGKSTGTAKNYLSAFRQAVEKGKPLTEWNAARAKSKPLRIKKAAGSPGIDAAVAKLYNHPSFKEWVGQIEMGLESFDSLYLTFRDYLLSEGYELADADDSSAS